VGFQRELLNLGCLIRIDGGGTNVLGAAARAWIQERVLIREIVKPAFWNDLDDRQRLIPQATSNKVDYSVLRQQIEDGKVESFTVNNNTLKISGEYKNGDKFESTAPPGNTPWPPALLPTLLSGSSPRP